MGWMFLDSNGNELPKWTDLASLARIQTPEQPLCGAASLVIAVDVSNPLLGGNGATQVFGQQKGLGETDLPRAEAYLAQLSAVTNRTFGHDYAAEPGAGAAGGLGFALRAFFQGQFQPGARVFAALSELDRRIAEADFVITAEGCFDEQSMMGKGVGTVAARAAAAQKPCVCLVAVNRALSTPLPWPHFCVHSIVPLIADAQHATAHAAACLQQLAARVASET
jgi:glycerate kinase